MGALAGMALALGVTVAVESAVGWLLGLRTWRSQGVLLLVNAVTNPTLNIAIGALAHFGVHRLSGPFDPLLLPMELAVAAVEAVLLRLALGKTWGWAAAMSALANTASWGAGAAIFRLFF